MKNLVRLIFSTRRYRPQQSPAASTRPIPAPIAGPVASPAERAVVHRKSEVSRPSRPTARKLVSTSTPPPMVSAEATFSRISEERLRAERRIQNTMAVTKATAIRLRAPPKASCAPPERLAAVKVSTAPKLRASAMAASTPVHTWGSRAF